MFSKNTPNLLCKPFGRDYSIAMPSRKELLKAVADIFRAVYLIEQPEETLAFRHLQGRGVNACDKYDAGQF